MTVGPIGAPLLALFSICSDTADLKPVCVCVCVAQELVCVCCHEDGELCGGGWGGDLRQTRLSSLQLGGWTMQSGGGVSTHIRTQINTHTHIQTHRGLTVGSVPAAIGPS